jgi:hypothetical protein
LGPIERANVNPSDSTPRHVQTNIRPCGGHQLDRKWDDDDDEWEPGARGLGGRGEESNFQAAVGKGDQQRTGRQCTAFPSTQTPCWVTSTFMTTSRCCWVATIRATLTWAVYGIMRPRRFVVTAALLLEQRTWKPAARTSGARMTRLEHESVGSYLKSLLRYNGNVGMAR